MELASNSKVSSSSSCSVSSGKLDKKRKLKDIGSSCDSKVEMMSEHKKALEWLCDEKKVMKWIGQFDLIDMFENSDGLLRIDNFAPDFVAEYALHVLKNELPKERWSVRQDQDNDEKNTTQHRFFVASPETPVSKSVKKVDKLWLLTRMIHSLFPEKRSVFSAGKYYSGDHITKHDDHAYVYHEMPDGSDKKPVFCSRDVAVIWYLTKDWKESDGGLLVDLGNDNKTYVPKFNSAVAFIVPRFHEVTPVLKRKGRDPRFSIFGWFLAEGDLYKYIPDKDEEKVETQKKKQNRKNKKNKRRKNKKKH